MEENAEGQRLDRIEVDIGELKSDVEVLKEDVEVLKEDVKVLKEDVKELKGDVKELKVGQKRLEEGQERHFKLLLDTLNAFREEDQRHIEILSEQHRTDLLAQGEGFKSHRDVLNDHEVRIQRLEEAS